VTSQPYFITAAQPQCGHDRKLSREHAVCIG
jgi:hypothetical protein